MEINGRVGRNLCFLPFWEETSGKFASKLAQFEFNKDMAGTNLPRKNWLVWMKLNRLLDCRPNMRMAWVSLTDQIAH